MADTSYAEEIQHTAVGDTRLERLRIKETGQEEIRLSWWPKGRFVPRPVDVPEVILITLLAKGIGEGILSPQFLKQLTEAAKIHGAP